MNIIETRAVLNIVKTVGIQKLTKCPESSFSKFLFLKVVNTISNVQCIAGSVIKYKDRAPD